MAIEKTIKLNVETGAAQKNTEDLTNVLKEQRAILIELEREYLEASQVLNKTSKSDFAGRKKATDQVKHLRDSIKDQRLSVRELSNEQTNLNKTSADTTKHHVEQGKALHLLDKATGGYLSESIELYSSASEGVVLLESVTGKWNIKQKLVTAGQYLWNLAISLNPIGLIIAAIIALIAMGAALFSFFSSAAAATAKHTAAVDANEKAMKKQTVALEKMREEAERAANQELAMAKASGASAEAIRKLELKLIDEKIARERSTKATLLDTYQTNKNSLAKLRAAGADEDIIKRQLEITAESGKNILKQNDNIKAALSEKKDIQNRHLVELKTEEIQAANDASQRGKEAAEKSRAAQKEINDKKIQDKKEHDKLVADGIAEAEKLETEKKNKFLKDIEDLKAINTKNTFTQQEQEEQAINAKYFALEQMAKGNAEQLAIIETAKNAELKVITDKYEKEKTAKEKADKALKDEFTLSEDAIAIQKIKDDYAIKAALAKEDADLIVLINAEKEEKIAAIEEAAAKKKKEIQIQGVADGLSTISNLTELFAGKSQAQQKKAFKIQKAVNIATAVLDTYKAANAALASAPPPFNFIAMAATITAGLVNVKKIASTEFNGDVGTSPPPPSDAGGSGSGGAITPSFNVVGNSGINQLAQIQQQPTQAYVVSGAVTSAQSLDRNRIQNATIG